jgi:hypothetical protein
MRVTVFTQFTAARARILMAGLAAGLAAMFWASEASAQSSTTCMAMGPDMVHCNTMDMSPPSPMEMSQPRSDGGAALGASLGGLISRINEGNLRKKVGRMLADGDCQGAMRYAYQKGRLELGAEIARMCAPRAMARAPAPAALQPRLSAQPPATPEKRRKWQSYYATLIEVGKTPKEARTMADNEVGAVD